MPKKNSWKSFFVSRWFILIAVVILLVMSVACFRAYLQNFDIQQEISRLKQETERLRVKKIATFDALRYAKSDTYVEEKARTELNMIKNGEKMAIINLSSGIMAKDRQLSSPVVTSNDRTNILNWLRYFFNN